MMLFKSSRMKGCHLGRDKDLSSRVLVPSYQIQWNNSSTTTKEATTAIFIPTEDTTHTKQKYKMPQQQHINSKSSFQQTHNNISSFGPIIISDTECKHMFQLINQNKHKLRQQKMIQKRFAIIQFLICQLQQINYPLIPCRSHYRRLLGEYSIISLTMVIRTSLIV